MMSPNAGIHSWAPPGWSQWLGERFWDSLYGSASIRGVLEEMPGRGLLQEGPVGLGRGMGDSLGLWGEFGSILEMPVHTPGGEATLELASTL
jgi:hypothetical protein